MTYYLYHLPIGRDGKPADLNKQKLVGDYNLIVAAKGAARRFIGKGRKFCIITSRPPKTPSDILYVVEYQNGSKYWKDPRTAEERTGWVYIPIHAGGTTVLVDYRGREKYRPKK